MKQLGLFDLKPCRNCGFVKHLTAFSKAGENRDGRSNQCKVCQASYYAKYRIENRQRLATIRAAWYQENRSSRLEYQVAYQYRNREKRLAASREYKRLHPDKCNAHKLVALALKAGKLKRRPCKTCGNEQAEAHHEDYSKPLKVNWLCRTCHGRLHVQLAG